MVAFYDHNLGPDDHNLALGDGPIRQVLHSLHRDGRADVALGGSADLPPGAVCEADPMDGPQPVLSDGDLTLRPWRADDAADVERACKDSEIQRWIQVPVPYLRSHAEEFVAETPARWAADTELRFASRAAVILSDWALAELGFARVLLFAHPDNPGSQGVATNAGFAPDPLAVRENRLGFSRQEQ